MMVFDFTSGKLRATDPPMIEFIGHLYRQSRYLGSASIDELNSRLHGLAAAILNYYADGTPCFEIPNNAQGMALLDLLHEFSIREVDFNAALADHLGRMSAALCSGEIRRLTEFVARFRGRKVIFKFLKKEHSDLLVGGSVRFGAANSYNDKSLPAAIQDDELAIDHQLKGLTMTTQSGQTIPIKDGRIASTAFGPYFISSFSVNCRIQFFQLFGATSCVAIADARNFADRVEEAHRQQYPNDSVLFSKVEYIDTFRRLKGKAPIEFRKSSNYEFEEEWRFASWPKTATTTAEANRTVTIDTHGLCIEKFDLETRI